jgi:hypothetical protein
MKIRVLWGIVVTLIVLIAVLAVKRTKAPEVSTPNNSVETSVSQVFSGEPAQIKNEAQPDGSQTSTLVYKDSTGAQKQEPLSEAEKSFAIMARSFFEFTGSNKSKEDFIAFLQSQGLKPIVAEDRQDLIEDLTIIRTQNSLPGIRYIHAQFDGDDEQELQHLSFEIKKGEGAHQKAVDFIQKVLPLGPQAEDTDEKMAIFRHDGYVVWLKELTAEDMIGDRFNAYDRGDIGNIRVAIERDIHPHHDY